MSRLDRYYIPPGVPARPPVPPPNNPGSSAGSAAPPLPKKKGILVPPPLPPSAPSSVLSGNTSSTVGIPVWAFQVRKTKIGKFHKIKSQRHFLCRVQCIYLSMFHTSVQHALINRPLMYISYERLFSHFSRSILYVYCAGLNISKDNCK